MDTAEWGVLSTYESADVLTRLYKHVHKDAELSAERASEIAAWFSQGREYFAAAQTSGPLVRPVLQYYGVLGLARGTILFLNKGANHGLSEAHGVCASGWKELLRRPEDRTAIALTVTTKGTFTSLAKITGNRDAFSYFKQFGLNRVHEEKFPVDRLPQASFSFHDTLARISDLGPIYHRCTGDQPAALPASLTVTDLNGVALNVHSLDPTDHESLSRTFCLSDQWTFRGRMFDADCFLLIDGSTFTDHLPHIEGHSDGTSAIVAPYPNGVRLSRLLRMHLLSAFLGTYARYHPEPWMAAVFGHVSGDHIMPLIRAATNLVETEYPRLIINELEDRV